MSEKSKRIIDIVQWILIGILMVTCVFVFIGNSKLKRERDEQRDLTYIRIYDSQTIESLKKKNRELYDSLMVANSRKPESALEIRYKYTLRTDTIKEKQFVKVQVRDTVYSSDSVFVEIPNDFSLYKYTSDNDTIQTNIDVMAKDLQWVKVDATVHDRFMIINRVGDDGTVETSITHGPNTEIEHLDTWHAKKTWKDRLFIGPSVSAGYDPINKNFGIMLGVSAGFKLW